MALLLDITADPQVQAELASKLEEYMPGCAMVHSDTIEHALKQIELQDIDTIFVDTRIAVKLRQDINVLLASTSLTTKIILIDSRQDMLNPELYNILGLKTINLPLDKEELHQAIG